MVFVASGSRLMKLRRDAARFAGSEDLDSSKSGKLLDVERLVDLEVLEPGLSVPGKKFSGIWISQLHFDGIVLLHRMISSITWRLTRKSMPAHAYINRQTSIKSIALACQR